MSNKNRQKTTGIDVRLAVILLCALCVGITVGLLTFAAYQEWAIAVIAGGTAVGTSAIFFGWLIKDA
jgi:hypothetical protein